MESMSEKAGKQESYQGDFVLKGQVLSKEFTHVNASWLEKCPTFEGMLQKAKEEQKRLVDYSGYSLSDVTPENGTLTFRRGEKVLHANLSLYSAQQLGNRVDVPGRYLSRLLEVNEKDLFDQNVKAGLARTLKEGNDPEMFLRTRVSDTGDSTLRAILSSRYGVINNLPLIETLSDIIPGGRVSHLFYNGDTLRANILVPDSIRQESDSDYGGGLSVMNNETGQLPMSSRPFVFRAICFNGNIWDRADGTEYSRKHLGDIDWTDLRKKLILNVQTQIPLALESIQRVLNLKGIPVSEEDIRKAIVYIAKREGITQTAAKDWYASYRIELASASTAKEIVSAFGVVQGLTRSAQNQEIGLQELMETLSGKLVDSNWDKLFTVSRNEVSQEEIEKVLLA